MKNKMMKWIGVSLAIVMMLPAQGVYGAQEIPMPEEIGEEIIVSENEVVEAPASEAEISENEAANDSEAAAEISENEPANDSDAATVISENEPANDSEAATETGENEAADEGAHLNLSPDADIDNDQNRQPLAEGIRFNVALKTPSYNYSGYENTPAFNISINYQSFDGTGIRNGLVKKQVLVENADYVTRYENNVNVGTAKAYAIGIGDYQFTYEREFEIYKRNAKSLRFPKVVRPVYLSEAKDGDVIALLKEKVPLYDGSRIVDPNDYDLTADGSLDQEGTVKLTVVLNPDGNYTGVTKASVVVRLEASDASETAAEVALKQPDKPIIYTGAEVKPPIMVKVDGKVVGGKDVIIYYENNVNATTPGNPAKAIAYGTGKFHGKLGEVTFEILPADIKKLKVQRLRPMIYRGSVAPINPRVMFGRQILKKGVDYELVVDQTEAELKSQISSVGRATATYTILPAAGNPNFADSAGGGVKGSYVLNCRNINSGLLIKAVGNVVTDPAEFASAKPELTITYDGEPLTEGVDYRTKYQTKINAKDGRVTVVATVIGKGMYTGQRTVKWVMMQGL